jgi:hypothetical protein
MEYIKKYKKYKNKYINLKLTFGGNYNITTNGNNQLYDPQTEESYDDNNKKTLDDNKQLYKTQNEESYDEDNQVNDENLKIINVKSMFNFRELNTNKTMETIISYNFINLFINNKINYEIDNDNYIVFIIKIFQYNMIDIFENTISLPGLSIILENTIEDELNVKQIYDFILGKKINCLHFIEMPTDNIVDGILLKELLEYLKIKNCKINKFKIKVILEKDEFYEKLKKEEEVKEKYNNINIIEEDDDIYIDNFTLDDMY